MKRLPILVLLILASLSGCKTRIVEKELVKLVAQPAPIDFIILQMNDVYEISPLDGGRVGGLARVATVLRQLEAHNPNTIAVLAGDFLSPSLTGSLNWQDLSPIAGAQMISVLNALGLDYITFGNHELDISHENLQKRINESQFDWFSGNVREVKNGETAPFQQGSKPLQDHVQHFFSNGQGDSVSLGLISVTLPFNQKDYVSYDNFIEAGKRSFEEAQAQSDLVFALTHLSIEQDRQLARAIPSLPLIMGGHEHEDTLHLEGNTTITKADANAKTVYIHWCSYNPSTQKTRIWSQLMPITSDISIDPQVERVVQKWESIANQSISSMGYDAEDVIATASEPLDGRESVVRTRPSNLGKLIANSLQNSVKVADLAILNGGSIRVDDKISGAISQKDILRTLPFGGAIVYGTFPGEVLQKTLQTGTETNVGQGGYLQLSSNVSLQAGQWYISDKALDPKASYTVALPAFLSKGLESNLGFLKELNYTQPVLTGVNGSKRNDIRDILILFLKNGGINSIE